MRKSWLLAVALLAYGLAGGTPARAHATVVQAETGTPSCTGSNGSVGTEFREDASEWNVATYRGSGCWMAYPPPVGDDRVVAIRYLTRGPGAVHCGHFDVSGVLQGTTASLCAPPGTWQRVPVAAVRVPPVSVFVNSYAITWVSDGPAVGSVAALVDTHTLGHGPECADGVDNDGNGVTDTNDPGCAGLADESEATPECSNGLDDDEDWYVDQQDPECASPDDDDESATGEGTVTSVTGPGCGINSDSDFEPTDGWGIGLGVGGPLVTTQVDASGAVSTGRADVECSIQVGSARHHDPDLWSEDANDAGEFGPFFDLDASMVSVTWDDDVRADVYVCTEVHAPGVPPFYDAASGLWRSDPEQAFCAQATRSPRGSVTVAPPVVAGPPA